MINVFFLFIMTLLILKPLFQKGFIDGHDNVFHFSQIRDLYLSVKNGNGFNSISSRLYNSIGYGSRLFYASFSHTITVIIGIIIEPFGLDLLVAFKVVIFLSVFLSGIMTYLFSLRLSKNHFYSVIAAIIYMAFPYRITDIFVRNAFAETVAFAFLPGIFWGIYEILNQEKTNYNHVIKGYLLVIINFSLLFLTHNITSVYCLVFLLIFILINLKKVILIINKNKINIFYSLFSILLILCITSKLSISLLEQRKVLDYVVFNSQDMGSTLERIISEISRTTGFLIAGTNDYPRIVLEITILTTLFLFLYLLLRKESKFRWQRYFLLFIPIIIVGLTILIFELNHNWYKYFFIPSFIILLINLVDYNIEEKNKSFKNYSELVGFSTILLITLIYLYNKNVWSLLPKFLYNIQFPWRLWTFAGLFIALLIPLLMSYLKINYKYKKIGLTVITTFVVVSIFPINMNVETYFNYQNQTFPTGFFSDDSLDNRSELYLNVRNYLDTVEDKSLVDVLYNGNFDFKAYTPVQSAIISKEKVNIPSYSCEVTTSENTLLLIPFIYFPGFKVVVKDLTLNETYEFTPFEYDYLVGFVLQTSGLTKFTVNVNYYHPADINNYPKHPNSGGWQREYFPAHFFDSEGYYDRSPLYRKIRNQIDKEAAGTVEHSYANRFVYNEDIKFNAESENENILIINQEVNTPTFKGVVKLSESCLRESEEAIIQIPFIYYNGYNATITNLNNNEKIAVEVYESDFLVTIKFDVTQGEEYQVNVKFSGTKVMQLSKIISNVAIFITILLPLLGYLANLLRKLKLSEK